MVLLLVVIVVVPVVPNVIVPVPPDVTVIPVDKVKLPYIVGADPTVSEPLNPVKTMSLAVPVQDKA